VIDGRPSRYSSEQGAAAVEASFTLSVLLLLIVCSMEFGRALWTQNTMLLAIQEAGRFAMISNYTPPIGCSVQSQAPWCPAPSNTPLANCSAARAQQVLSAYQATNIDVSVTEDNTSTPATITICASHSFGFVAPTLLPLGGVPVNLTRQVTVPLALRR
jgi:Flp pilus assembly protein TadG